MKQDTKGTTDTRDTSYLLLPVPGGSEGRYSAFPTAPFRNAMSFYRYPLLWELEALCRAAQVGFRVVAVMDAGALKQRGIVTAESSQVNLLRSMSSFVTLLAVQLRGLSYAKRVCVEREALAASPELLAQLLAQPERRCASGFAARDRMMQVLDAAAPEMSEPLLPLKHAVNLLHDSCRCAADAVKGAGSTGNDPASAPVASERATYARTVLEERGLDVAEFFSAAGELAAAQQSTVVPKLGGLGSPLPQRLAFLAGAEGTGHHLWVFAILANCSGSICASSTDMSRRLAELQIIGKHASHALVASAHASRTAQAERDFACGLAAARQGAVARTEAAAAGVALVARGQACDNVTMCSPAPVVFINGRTTNTYGQMSYPSCTWLACCAAAAATTGLNRLGSVGVGWIRGLALWLFG
jgi:hypothetical protein